MRKIWRSFCITLSLYSAIPVPQQEWKKENMQYALCFFPFIGLVIAGAVFGWWHLCRIGGITPALFAAVSAILPLLVSGGIHMDGWMDTVDALSSHADIPRKLEILKDPHMGAFGVMAFGGLLMLQFALWWQLYETPEFFLLAVVGFLASRCLNAVSIAVFSCAKDTGLVRVFSDNSSRRAVIICNMTFLALILGYLLAYIPIWGGIAAGLSVGYFVFHRRFCIKQFGGNTGDLAGYLLQTVELICLAVAAIGGVVA